MDQTGSFGSAAGGLSPELQAAMSRRGGQAGATGAVTQGAPTFDPTTQPAAPPTGQPPMPMGGQPMAASAPTPALPFEGSEAIKIIDAMNGRLKALSKIDELRLGGGI